MKLILIYFSILPNIILYTILGLLSPTYVFLPNVSTHVVVKWKLLVRIVKVLTVDCVVGKVIIILSIDTCYEN